MFVTRTVVLAAVAAGLSAPALAAGPPDWSAIPTKTVTLFYPGQSSYTWLRSDEHPGARMVTKGKRCTTCHKGKEAKMGAKTVSGKNIEPAPIAGKNGSVELSVQAAYDDKNLYWRFSWKTNMDRPGQMHNYMRFDGEKWAMYGGPRSSSKVRSGAQPPLYEDRLAIMIDDGSVPGFAEQGCWLTCHNGMRDMPGQPKKAEVKALPLIGQQMKKSDIRKYLPATRTDDAASWDKTKPAGEIAGLKAAGAFLDLMQWRAARSNPVGMADDGYVLEYRLFDEGKNPFSWNVDRKTMTPKYMFDPAKNGGMTGLTVGDVGKPGKPYAVIRENNAVPYVGNGTWKKDDVLPGRLESRAGAKGSAADNAQAQGTWRNGVWTVVWTRPLDTGHPADDKILKEGGVYTVGFGIHDDNVTTRFHQVSFPLTLGLGARADIKATKLK
jgi:hypothetical protein